MGKRAWREESFQETRRLVVQIMRVQRRSRAESTREAIREREEEKKTATILAARRRMLARTLIWGGQCQLEGMVGRCSAEDRHAYVDGPAGVLLGLGALLPLVLW